MRLSDSLQSAAPGWQMMAAAASIFLLVLLLNSVTPLLADDYSYAFNFADGSRIQSLSDIVRSQQFAYHNVNGRILGGMLVHLFVLVGKPAFNVLNSLAYLTVVLLIYANINGARPSRPALLLAIALMLWFALASFGESVLWLAGAANYLWLIIPALLLLVRMRVYAEVGVVGRDGFLDAGWGLLIGLIAGSGNENIGPTLALVLVGYLIYYRVRGYVIPGWAWTRLAGAVAGSIIVIAAPGNFVRMDTVDSTTLSAAILLDRLATVSHIIFLNNLFVLFAAFLIGVVFLREFGGEHSTIALHLGILHMAAAFVATYAMVLSPHFPARAWTGIIVFAVISVLSVWTALDSRQPFVLAVYRTILGSAMLLFAVRYAYVYTQDLRVTHARWEQRVDYIREEKAAGRTDVVVPPIGGETRYNPASSVKDLDQRSDEWPNVDVARYYGLDSIRASD